MQRSFRSAGAKTRRAQATIGWALLALTLVSSLALGANRPVSWSFLALGVSGLFICQLVIDVTSHLPGFSTRTVPAAALFLCAIAWAFVQTLPGANDYLAHPVWARVSGGIDSISADPIAGRQFIMRLASYGMVFWITVRSVAQRARAERFLKTVAVFSTALAIFGIVAYLSATNPIVGQSVGADVVRASFVNRNSYATYAVFGALANLAILFQASARSKRATDTRRRLRDFLEGFFAGTWIYAFGVILCAGAIILTQSRGGAVAGAIALLTFLVSNQRSGRRTSPAIFGIIIAAVGIAAISANSGLIQRLLATSEENLRFTVFPLVYDGITERPILGHGLGAFHETFRAHVPLQAAIGEWDMAHNSYLENAYELGIPAAASFYLALILITWRIWRGTVERKRDRAIVAFSFACIAGAGFHAMFDFSLQMPATATLFAFILGLGWTQSFSSVCRS